MPVTYHVYLNNSVNNSQTFVSTVIASSAQEAINRTRPQIRVSLAPGRRFSLSAYTVQEDIVRTLDGNSDITISTNININQNTAPALSYPDAAPTETFSCAINSIITSIATAISNDDRFVDCTIDVNKLIRCLSEILEHKQPLPQALEQDLLLSDKDFFNPNIDPAIREYRETWRRFMRIYLAFKYNIFDEVRVPLKPKDGANNPQNVVDFTPEDVTDLLDRLRKTQNQLESRIATIKRDRNIDDFQAAIDTDPQVAVLRAIIQDLTDQLETLQSDNCSDHEDCYVDINLKPIFQSQQIKLRERKTSFNLSISYLLLLAAQQIKNGQSVPYVIKAGDEYKSTQTSNEVITFTTNQVQSWQGDFHQVSIIGIKTDSDNSITLTIQDSYSVRGSNNKNIFKIKFTDLLFQNQIQLGLFNNFSFGFDDGVLNKPNQLLIGVDVTFGVVGNSSLCCVKS